MNKLSQTSKWVIVGAVIIVAVVLIAVYGGSNSGTPAPGNSSSTASDSNSASNTVANGNVPATGNTTPPKATGGSTGTPTSAPHPMPIVFVTPVPGDTWKISSQNPIQWSREAGTNAEIDLISVGTGKLIGVILNVAGPHQTFYYWNTRDLLQSNTSPVKMSVTPGTYLIRITFSGNNLSPITSKPVTLTN